MQAESNTVIEAALPRPEPAARPARAAAVPVAPSFVPRGPAVAAPVTCYLRCKGVLDVALALALLVLAAPVILLACVLVRLTSRGPALYSQTRVGRGGRPFTIWKIRSMYHNCEAASGVRWSHKGDPRVMPLGRLLRRTHIDELPQLWNILKGDMSLVGPRPERPEFVPQLEAAIPRYRERLQVRPGVTGLAQIHLGPDTDLPGVERKLAMDLYYIKTLGPWADLRILLATAVHVIKPYVADKWFFRLSPQKCADALKASPAPSGPGGTIAAPSHSRP
jgi:lipopolysaccharide/colanic/teichoic acid biosynthesis glycosyltransferase